MAIPGFDSNANFAVGNIATAPSPAISGTSLILGAGQGARMPAVPFNATMWPSGQVADPTNCEIVRVTARSTDTLTIVRAQESSTAMSVGVGYYFAAPITKLTLDDIEQQIADGIGYDVTRNKIANLVGDDSTDNTSAWTTLFAGLPVGATVFFPAGTYRGNFIISADKHLNIVGAGRYSTIIKANHALGDPTAFHINGQYWYNQFSDLGFASTSTTSAATKGIYIDPGGAGSAVGININRCDFNGLGTAIHAVGIGAGNVSVWNDLSITAPTTITGARGIVLNGTNINMQITNTTINLVAAAANSSACVEINAMGALQATNCDWIGGTNTLLFNASGLLAACQFSNCYFDQSGGSTVKFTGSSAISRITFSQCGITGGNVAGATAVEIAGTGTGAAGTATAQPDGLDFLNCNIYPNSGSGTTNGFLINGCQGVNIADCRISGWTNGIQVTPTISNGYTKVSIKDCKMGATNNFTTANAVGVLLNAGSFQYGALAISDNDFQGSTLPITDNSTMVAGANKNIAGNLGLAIGAIRTTTVASFTAQTQILNVPIPAGALRVGVAYVVKIRGSRATSDTGATTLIVTAGTAGTIADGTVVSLAPAHTAVAAQAFSAEFEIVCRAIGAGTTTLAGTGSALIQTNAAAAAPAGGYARGIATTLATLTHTNAMFLGINAAHATNGITIDFCSIEVKQQ